MLRPSTAAVVVVVVVVATAAALQIEAVVQTIEASRFSLPRIFQPILLVLENLSCRPSRRMSTVQIRADAEFFHSTVDFLECVIDAS